jgi:hypothetical protein
MSEYRKQYRQEEFLANALSKNSYPDNNRWSGIR